MTRLVTLNTSDQHHTFCIILAAGLTGPLFLKAAVDALSAANAAATTAVGVAASGLGPAVQAIVWFGLAGVLQHVAKELQFPTFSPVSQVGGGKGCGAGGGGGLGSKHRTWANVWEV